MNYTDVKDITLAVQLHCTGYEGNALPLLMGRELHHQLVPGNHSFDLRPTAIPSDRYRVSMTPLVDAPEAGWVTTKVGLEVNASHLGFMPLAMYLGAPSDWSSGLVRFPQPYGPIPGPGFHSLAQGPVWTLGFRRAS